ncbi:hypothetical protein B0H63DRAFT_85232 [Podospora didyma]|uniref:Uncharacterized protein n=1 Tax=Podospora didyma TaxID=330526 RepID=A0AAE0N2G7_9PEZI|nr:hypothetical protein B0H63DRAFT_85232 [Podospora didyma]
MGLSIIDRIQAKIELFRLEQRYTRRRNRRSTFVSTAVYVDGEYIYNSPNTTGSSANTSRTNNSPDSVTPPSPLSASSPVESETATKAQKRLHRWSSMPGFGSMSKASAGGMPTHREQEQEQDWRTARRGSMDR